MEEKSQPSKIELSNILAALVAIVCIFLGTNAHSQTSPDSFVFSGSFPSWSPQFSNLYAEVLKLSDGVYVSLAILETQTPTYVSLIGHCSAYGYLDPSYDGSITCHYSLGREILEIVHKPNEPSSSAQFFVAEMGFFDLYLVTQGWITPIPQ